MEVENEIKLIKKLLDVVPSDVNYFEFQKNFEDRAQSYKSRLWSVSSWLFGFQIALVFSVFSLEYVKLVNDEIKVVWMVPVFFTYMLEISLFIYTLLFINKMDKHIKRNELRGNIILEYKDNWDRWKQDKDPKAREIYLEPVFAYRQGKSNGYFQNMLQMFSLSVFLIHTAVFGYLLFCI